MISCERLALTVDRGFVGVGVGVVADAADELWAHGLAVVLHGLDLRRAGGGVRAEDSLAVLAAVGVSARIATTQRAH